MLLLLVFQLLNSEVVGDLTKINTSLKFVVKLFVVGPERALNKAFKIGECSVAVLRYRQVGIYIQWKF